MKKYYIIISVAFIVLITIIVLCHKRELTVHADYIALSELNLSDSSFLVQLDSIVIRSPYYSNNGKYKTFTLGFLENKDSCLMFIISEEKMYTIREYIDEYYGIFILNNSYEFYVNETGFSVGIFLDTGKKRKYRLLPKPIIPIIYDPASWIIMYCQNQMLFIE